MPFPNVEKTLDLLGYKMRDKISGIEGVVTTLSFDLYGCVQAALHSGIDKDGKIAEQFWFDVQRLEPLAGKRVMEPPTIGDAPPAQYDNGPADKPRPRSI